MVFADEDAVKIVWVFVCVTAVVATDEVCTLSVLCSDGIVLLVVLFDLTSADTLWTAVADEFV